MVDRSNVPTAITVSPSNKVNPDMEKQDSIPTTDSKAELKDNVEDENSAW